MASVFGKIVEWLEHDGIRLSQRFIVTASEAKQSIAAKRDWIASSRSLSSGAHLRDPLAPRKDGGGVIQLQIIPL
jgi:hypothetical protein